MNREGSAASIGTPRSPVAVLRAATERVAARMGEIYPPLAPGGALRAEGYLGTLHAGLEDVLNGGDPGPLREGLAASPVSGPIIDALGRELIEGALAEPDDSGAALTALRAWASVRLDATRGPRPAPEHVDDLRARMRGPDAFELLVEVAHDFRSPLTSILFLAETLRDGHSGSLTEGQRSQLGLMYSAAFGLASIASDVMDLARREQDLIGDQGEPFSPAEIFQRVERMVRPLVEEKGLQLRITVPERWQVHGYPHALGRVLLNLTTNALKFTDQGSVEIGARPLPHNRIEFYVQDTGRGITPEQQKNLFLPFRKRPGGQREGYYFSSSGIGLSIARRLLRAMGSDLSLDSSDERGTRFSFALPTTGRR